MQMRISLSDGGRLPNLDIIWEGDEHCLNFHEITVRPGFKFLILNQYFHNEQIIRMSSAQSPLELSFMLRGRADYLVRHGLKVYYEGTSGPGQAWLNYLPECTGYSRIPAKQQVTMVCFLFSHYALAEFMEVEQLACGSSFLSDFRRENSELILMNCHLIPSIEMVVQQVLNCPVRGKATPMYLEAKMLELISLQLTQFLPDCCRSLSNRLAAGDVKKIKTAREILVSQLDNPPALLDLAKEVGLNRNKLNNGFREVFGETVFAWLRRERLEKARMLLQDENFNVTQIAHSLGFSSHSHFTNLFRRQFGLTPRRYRQNL